VGEGEEGHRNVIYAAVMGSDDVIMYSLLAAVAIVIVILSIIANE